jgi:hypothetical protein
MVDLADRVRIHDVDTHLLEPSDLWTSRVSPRWGDDVPHLVEDPETGFDVWYIGGRAICRAGPFASAGWEEFAPSRPKRMADVDPGAWQPQRRLGWMDKHGIYSQILYPNVLGGS